MSDKGVNTRFSGIKHFDDWTFECLRSEPEDIQAKVREWLAEMKHQIQHSIPPHITIPCSLDDTRPTGAAYRVFEMLVSENGGGKPIAVKMTKNSIEAWFDVSISGLD